MDTDEVPDFRARRAMFQQMSKAANAPQPTPNHQTAHKIGPRYLRDGALNQKSLENGRVMSNDDYLGKPGLLQKPFALPRVSKFGGVSMDSKIGEPKVNKLLSMGGSACPLVDPETHHRIDTTRVHQVREDMNPETMIDKKQFRNTLLTWENASFNTIERKKDPHPRCINQSPISTEVDQEKVPSLYLQEHKSISKDHEIIFPRIRSLQKVELLGPPPRKPERPPVVDLRTFLASTSQVDSNKDTVDHLPFPELIDEDEPEIYDDVLNVKAALNIMDGSSTTEYYHSDYVTLIPEKEAESVNMKNWQNEVLEDLYYDVEGFNSELNQMESSTFTSDSFSENSTEVYDDIHDVNKEDNSSVKSEKEVKLKGLGRIFKKNKEKMMQKNAKSKENEIFKATSVQNLKAEDGDLDFDAVYNDVENGISQNVLKKGDDKQKTRIPKFLLSKEGKEKRKSLDWIERTVLKCKTKKMAKEEKLFRERFQYSKDIEVINSAVVDSSVNIGKLGKRDLPITPGEELDIIDITNENLVICRNSDGKYGYVLMENLNFKN